MSLASDLLGVKKRSAERNGGIGSKFPVPSGSPLPFVTPSGSPPPPPPSSSPPPMVSGGGGGGKRMDGLSRELLLLTGGILPPSTIAPTTSFKEKPKQKVTWIWKSFKNSARTDDMLLHHWAKGPNGGAVSGEGTAPDTSVGDKNEDYSFARFNKRIKMVEYTPEEYKLVLSNLQPLPKKTEKELHGFEPWTKEDTDLLFQLCKQYDLRFQVIDDKWPQDRSRRRIDELKDRYYSVVRKLVESRQKAKLPTPTGALQKHCAAIVSNPFDVEYELLRKKQLEEQYQRSKDELRMEEETVREARRIEANRKRLLKERQRIQKLLLPAGDIAVVEGEEGGGGAAGGAMSRSGSKSKGKPSIPGTVDPVLTLPTKNFPHRKAWNCAHARSSFIYQSVTQSARLAKRVEMTLDEQKVGLRPMATAAVVDAYDLLRVEILAHTEMQRTVGRKEEEVHLMRVKLAKLKGETPPQPPPGVNLSHKKRKTDDLLDRSFGSTSLFNASSTQPASTTLSHKRRKKH